MKEVIIADKQKYLEEEYPFDDTPQLSDRKYCLHCGEIITVGDYKVLIDEDDEEFICCPNAPECSGTIIDWMPPDFKQ